MGWANKAEWNDYFCDKKMKALCQPEPTGVLSYKVLPGEYNFWDAEAQCLADGGHLATINSPEHQELAMAAIHAANVGKVWFGYHDNQWENTFQFIDGTVPHWSNWHAGEPNNAGGEHCAMIGWFANN